MICRARWIRDESGAATVMSLSVFSVSLLLAGLAIDTANVWRHREVLQLSADVAAQAGLHALARGESPEKAHAAALAAVEWNTPEAVYGKLIGDPIEDVSVVSFDGASSSFGSDDTLNAVRVSLRSSSENGSAVPTLILGLVGLNDWTVGAGSISALLPTQSCSGAEGLFSSGPVTLEDSSSFGENYCLHSQTSVDMLYGARFEDGAKLSLPDQADCGVGCNNSENPELKAARSELNLQIPDAADRIAELAAGFTDPNVILLEEADFFATRPLDEDLSPLEEMMVDTSELQSGSLVQLSPMEFTKMRAFPAGLTYSVSCDPENVPEGDPVITKLAFDGAGNRQVLRDMALVTDCPVWFDPRVTIDGSMILTTWAEEEPALSAEIGAQAGDPDQGCEPGRQSVLLSAGPVEIPAEFLASNAALVTAGDFELAGSASDLVMRHRGSAIHVGGELSVQGRHEFQSCGRAASSLLPNLRVIRQVMTEVPLPKPDEVAPDMPGDRPEELEKTPEIIRPGYQTRRSGRGALQPLTCNLCKARLVRAAVQIPGAERRKAVLNPRDPPLLRRVSDR